MLKEEGEREENESVEEKKKERNAEKGKKTEIKSGRIRESNKRRGFWKTETKLQERDEFN